MLITVFSQSKFHLEKPMFAILLATLFSLPSSVTSVEEEKRWGFYRMTDTRPYVMVRVLLTKKETCHGAPDRATCHQMWDALPKNAPIEAGEVEYLQQLGNKEYRMRITQEDFCNWRAADKTRFNVIACEDDWKQFVEKYSLNK